MASVMTTREAAEYLRTSEDSIKRFARAGQIPAAKLGRAWRFVKDDLDRWLARGGMAPERDSADSIAMMASQKRKCAPTKRMPRSINTVYKDFRKTKTPG